MNLLPQPLDGVVYKYITYDEIPVLFTSLQTSSEHPFKNNNSATPLPLTVLNRTQNNVSYDYNSKNHLSIVGSVTQDSTAGSKSSIVTTVSRDERRLSELPYDTLVWVMLSKGKRKSAAELYRRARILNKVCSASSNKSTAKQEYQQQDEPRYLVQYPSGSTYHVRSSFVLPVLEPRKTYSRLVIVADETPQYRRTAVVHTCFGDSFLEIGCDFGTCTDKVRHVLQNIPHASSLVSDGLYKLQGHEQDKSRVSCIGIDKSPTSIDIAKGRFPRTFFSLEDALTTEGTKKLRNLCRENLHDHYPTVVAIDINGNRDIADVVECLSLVIRPSGDDVVMNVNWELPRLIIVKSRFLFQEMKQHRNGDFHHHDLVH